MKPNKRNNRMLRPTREKQDLNTFVLKDLNDLKEQHNAEEKRKNAEKEKLISDIQAYSKKLELLKEDKQASIEEAKNDNILFKVKSFFKKHYLGIGTTAGLLLIVGSSFQLGSIYGNYNAEKNQLVYSKKGTLLTNDSALNGLLNNSQNQSVIMTQIVNKLLKDEYGLTKKQQENVNKSIKKVKVQLGQYYKASIAQRGYDENTFKMTVENQVIVKDQIKKNYKPTNEQLKTKYNEIEKRYSINGIYITPTNEKVTENELTDQTNNLLKEIKDNKLDFKDAAKIKNDQIVVSGIGLNGNVLNDEISSNNYASLSNVIKNELEKHKENDVFVIKDLQYGNAIIKINQIKNKNSFKSEKSKLETEIKKQMSNNDEQQVLFIKKLLEKNNVKSNNKDVENVIKNSLN